MPKEPKDKTQNLPVPQASSQQEQKPISKMKPWRAVSLEEARRLGVPIGNDLIISPVPSEASKD